MEDKCAECGRKLQVLEGFFIRGHFGEKVVCEDCYDSIVGDD